MSIQRRKNLSLLISLTIKNFTLVEQLHVEFLDGMTAITGETGAGKSLVLDALGIALGDRGDVGKVRHGKERLDVSAVFSIKDNQQARLWFQENDHEPAEECIIRRTLTADGRSRGFINGQPVPMQQLQQLGDLMIDIHSQHEHQSLLLKDTHRRLLDAFAGCEDLTEQVNRLFKEWHLTRRKLLELSENSREIDAKRELLAFQVQEFDELGLTEGELDELEKERHLLANAEQILQDSYQVLAICGDSDGDDVQTLLSRANQLLNNLPERSKELQDAEAMLSTALINVEEASREIQHYVESFEADPQRLQEIDARLSLAYQLARKHKVSPKVMLEHYQCLCSELEQLSSEESSLENLSDQVVELDRKLEKLESQLTRERTKAAGNFALEVNSQLSRLGMPNAVLEVKLAPQKEHGAYGAESVEFLISTNPGQAAGSLNKVASGGELSRISLAIQVIAAQHSTIPTLVFDEVDVGVGGAVAEVIGRLLRQLGKKGQVICVTHLPQVGSCAHHHMVASKHSDGRTTESQLVTLTESQRVDEIARMLGGSRITDQTLRHAHEMLHLSSA